MIKSFVSQKNILAKLSYCLLLILIILLLYGCDSKKPPTNSGNDEAANNPSPTVAEQITVAPLPTESPSVINDPTNNEYAYIDELGTTLPSRINSPVGYARIPSAPGELTAFLRELPLKESGSNVMLYDGQPKGNQSDHIAVFDLTLDDRDLQQCADSAIRIYAEYYWSIGDYDKIAFHLTNGFLMEYSQWRDGNRLVVNGNEVSWSKTSAYDASYETFHSYLAMVFAYAGTLSLSQECDAVNLEELRPGDMFLQGGSPGHCVLVVDIAQDEAGNNCYLLAQGYMPAQDFHVLKNPLHLEDPWYYASEIIFPFHTPAWVFEEGSLVRWGNFPLNEEDAPLAFNSADKTDSIATDKDDAIPAMSEEVQTVTDPSSEVTLLAVGDNLIHLEVVQSGKKKDGTYNFDHLYSNLKEEISAADIAVVNQETILGGDDFAYTGYPNFNSPTEIGGALVNAGFDVVLHATNHTMDKGLKGIENTIAYWKTKPEITVLGINETDQSSHRIPIIEKNGIKIAMLNYTYSLNGYSLPDDMPYLVNMLDKKKMAEDIQQAESLADFTIVFPHWGSEYVYEATQVQEDLTDFYYEHGVDLIIGAHPHVIEPVEWIETDKGHRMLVYYSLGNFMSYQKEAPRMLGAMAGVTIVKDETGTYISEAEVTPLVTHFENGPADFNYGIYKLNDYTTELAKVHGVSDIAKYGAMDYQTTYDLAKQVLGSWFDTPWKKID